MSKVFIEGMDMPKTCAVMCECGKQTPLYFSKQAAIDAWNKRS